MNSQLSNVRICPIVIVGHPRSGTTWLTELLGIHSRLAAGTETHLFNFYLERLFKERQKWLWDWIDDATLDGLIADFITGVFQAKLEATGKVRIVEKTPTHRFWVGKIISLFPGAKIVHCIRDGRDVALSLLARRERKGESWIPETVEACAKSWKKSIELGEQWKWEFGVSAIVEVRYEDLVRRPEEELSKLLGRVGESTPPEVVREMVSQHPPSPNSLKKWRSKMPSSDQARFLDAAGDTLAMLGYPSEQTCTDEEGRRC